MHINVEDVIVEVENGDIIVTNLASLSFPIIRYRLGDQVTVSDERCSCGRAHPVIADIMGRRGAAVVGHTTRYPALTFYYVFKNLALTRAVLLNYKAVQDSAGVVSIDIEGQANRSHEPLVRAELTKYFGEDVEFSIHFVDAFERRKRKAQYFESRIAS